MNEKLKRILANVHKYNDKNMAQLTFGLDSSIYYDALVVAPSWKPTKIIKDSTFKVTTLVEHSYISGYLVKKDSLKIAWIQIASGASNLIDSLVICAELQFKKLIFVGAVGSLNFDLHVGDLCTPSYSIAGVFANAYLEDKLTDYKLFQKVFPPDEDYINYIIEEAKKQNLNLKKASVFCTDSICLEYSRLDEIKSYNTDSIEMETSSFYLLASLFEVPSIALLVVSDNSAVGHPLLGRNSELNNKYDYGRKILIPELIYQISKE